MHFLQNNCTSFYLFLSISDFPFGGEKQHQNEDDEDTKNFQEEELFKPTNISNSVQPTEGFARA